MPEHIVASFDEDLAELSHRIAVLGGLAEQLVSQSIVALTRGDLERAENVIDDDLKLDGLHREIEERAILTIARRQPMAQDLRAIVAAIRIAGDLERIGDLAKNIAKRVIAIRGKSQSQKLVHGVEHMADLSLEQVKNVLDAYAGRDLEQALGVWRRDNAIDALYTSLFRELLTYMMEDPRNITFCTHLLFCAKNVERIGDHATNIAETVHYMVTGTILAEERPKQDASSLTHVEYTESDD